MPETIQPPTSSLEAFERYQDRQPLTQDLAELALGKTPDEEILHPAEKAGKDTNKVTARVPAWREARPGLLDWTPSRQQLVALAETIGSEGWPVFLDLMKKRLEVLREAAITVSQNDPLAQPDVVAREWAYHAQYKRVVAEMEPMMREQLDRLKVKE